MELKVFVGENPNTGEKGTQGAGEDVYFGTVVPDHIGENYAFIHQCAIVGGKLVIEVTEKPLNVDISSVTIGGVQTALTWDDATKSLSGTASAELVAIFDQVGGNSDSAGGSAPVAPPPNNTTFVSANATTASNQDDIEITFNDTGMYAMVHTEWAIKVNGGAEVTPTGASGHNQVHGYLKFPKGTYKAGDTITISHLVADSGVVKFTDKPVTNSVT